MPSNHGYNTPTKGSADWDVPLNENFNQLDTDVEIRDTETSKSDYDPKEGAKFLAIDTGEIYLGDDSVWINIGSIDNEGTTMPYELASSPDELNDILSSFPKRGGMVRLEPGTYNDTDWTDTIQIPTEPEYVGIDMRGSTIDIDSFAGPYLQRQSGSSRNDIVEIYGPTIFNVNDVTDPGIVLDLYNIQMSTVWWPDCFGPVDAIYSERMTEGSGHMNQVFVQGYGMQKGIIIGNQDDPQTTDRSFYWGQLGGIEDIGVHIRKGQTNHFYVQPEREKSGYSATGYLDEWGNNIIYNCHGQISTPLDIRAPYTILKMPGQFGGWKDSKVGVPPRNIDDAMGHTYIDNFQVDTLDQYDSEATNGAVSFNKSHSRVDLNAGATDGESANLTTPTGIGDPRHGCAVAARFELNGTTGRRDQFGLYLDDSNHVMFESNVSETGSWHVIAREEGRKQADIDTGIPLDEDLHEYQIWYAGYSDFYFYYDYDLVASITNTYDEGYNVWQMRERIDTTVVGSPANNIKIYIQGIEIFTNEGRRVSIAP